MTRLFSRSVTIVVVLASILLAECIGQALFCWRNPAHQTLFSISWTSHQLFERHPYLSIKGRPNVHVLNNGTLIAHNSFGYRGPDPTRIPRASRVTIAALGGSSTYCVSL
ncbi:MAG: hypothetical protein HY270_01840 [Deltaproteobacteria bacterium]|nr:hypothetical protein [Deltaproteobacteria bacterium]